MFLGNFHIENFTSPIIQEKTENVLKQILTLLHSLIIFRLFVKHEIGNLLVKFLYSYYYKRGMIQVHKANGKFEPFNEDKLRYSIQRAGIAADLQDEIVEHIKNKLYDKIPSREIFHCIEEYLEQSQRHSIKAKYSLKQAIMELGPSGFPFEDYISEILKSQGYETQVRQILKGGCITHEIDVVAQNASQKIMVEAKFHNSPGIRTDIHVALYTKARFDDIKEKNNMSTVWLVTNTKATPDAIAYGDCMGVTLISWSHPEGKSLRDIIEQAGLTPVTALTALSLSQKQQLLQNHIVLCKAITQNPNVLDVLYLDFEKKRKVLEEAQYLSKK